MANVAAPTSPLAAALFLLARKGSGDCGDHDWYHQDISVEACYHCRSTRPYDRWHFEMQPLGDVDG